MQTSEGLAKVATRRESVRNAVKRWRKTHPDRYNEYMREYLKRPGPKKRHLERCRAYRARKKLKSQEVKQDVFVPGVEVQQNPAS